MIKTADKPSLTIEQLDGFTAKFSATVGKVGTKNNCSEFTRVLIDIKFNGNIIKDHSWVNKCQVGNIRKGSNISFKAKVSKYLSIDDDGKQIMKFKFSRIRNIKIIKG